ncbi:MAG: NRDE family protein [Saprospiraceae bacterium]
MCTVTWIPDGSGGHFLTSNRDEAPHRAALQLTHRQTASGETLHYPVDSGAGGTWICFSDQGRAICLLNGARRKHRHRPPYRRSRGLVVLDAFEGKDFSTFIDAYDLVGIEPFTMVMADEEDARVLIWNGRKKEVEEIAPGEMRIWSSSTLYPYPVRRRRRRLFASFLRNHPQPDLDQILSFHHLETGDQHNDFIMNRQDRVRTISVTAAHLSSRDPYWIHKDLLHPKTERRELVQKH